MGLFVYTQKGSIISMVDLPTTEIIEPIKVKKALAKCFFLCYHGHITKRIVTGQQAKPK